MSNIHFENLPDEILLKVLKYLEIKDLLKCSQLSKIIRRLCHDEILWEKLNLCKKRVPSEFIELILKNGCKYLSLQNANLDGPLYLNSKSQLKYLEVTSCKVNNVLLSAGLEERAVFETLLASCDSLQKLSLANLTATENMILKSPCFNDKLQILQMDSCRGLNLDSIKVGSEYAFLLFCARTTCKTCWM